MEIDRVSLYKPWEINGYLGDFNAFNVFRLQIHLSQIESSPQAKNIFMFNT